MRRLWGLALGLGLVLAIPLEVQGQIFFGPARRIQVVSTLSATCNFSTSSADLTYLTSDGKTYICTATNTWTSISGGVASTRSIFTTLPLTGGGDLSADRTLAINNFTGDSGAGGLKGAVPAPAAGDAAALKFLKADGTWATPAGGSAPFSDATAIVMNAADNTKLFKINAAGITTGNTVTANSPAATGSFTFATTDTAQTISGQKSFSAAILGPVGNTPSTPAFAGIGGTNAGLYFRSIGNSNIASAGLCQVDFASSLGLLLTTNAPTVGWTGSSLCGSGARTSISEVASGVLGVAAGNAAATDGWLVDAGRTRMNADVTNATTTFGAMTGLTATLKAGRKYTGQLDIKCNDSTAVDGIKFDFNGGTATMTSFWAASSDPVGSSVLGTVISTSLAGVMNFTTLTGENVIHITFSAVVNAAGTFIPEFAQNSHSAGTATAELGSFMWTEDTP